MTGMGVFVVLVPVLDLIGLAVRRGISAVWMSTPLIFLVVGPLIFAFVMAVNYSQWRTEAKEIKALIAAVVARPLSPGPREA